MPGAPLCDTCIRVLAGPGDTACLRCGHPWAYEVPTCAECPAGVAWARHAAAYDPALARVISALKDSGRRALGAPLAQLMIDRIAVPPSGAVLVPVPLSPRRLRQRGFNQAGVLASYLARTWGTPVMEVLARPDDGRHQRGASRGDRLVLVRDVFTCAVRAPYHAVLVDDVLTTGATVTAAARVLRAAGCARVGAVVTARVVLASGRTRVG